MKLDELTGVKQYQDKTLSELITHVMAENGFDLLGAGSFGVAFRKGNDPFVYKIFVKDTCYHDFMLFVQSQKDSHYPIVKGFKSLTAFWKRAPENIDERLYIAKVEYIRPSIYEKQNKINGLTDQMISTTMSSLQAGQNKKSILKYIMKSLKESKQNFNDPSMSSSELTSTAIKILSFVESWEALYNVIHEQCDMDIHDGNYGYRANGDLVVLDPAAHGGEYEERMLNHPLDRDGGYED
jgi:hypothetical protein